MINWLKYKKIYFAFSLLMLGVSMYGLLMWGLKLGVDFTGGSIIEYKIEKDISTEELTNDLRGNDIDVTVVQSTGPDTYLIKLPPIAEEQKDQIASIAGQLTLDEGEIHATPSMNVEELRFENVGPSVGPELVQKTIYAILIAAGGILLWVAYQFKSIKFGFSAILAMFHDSFILIGSFSLLGHFFGAEVDFLFVTALLTTLSFSVHDTIVVFDRIREIGKGGRVVDTDVANQALTETMVRSLNNSFTIIFMLVALLLLGGTTIKWFAMALLIGTILGTYSSPFVAVPLLVSWEAAAKILRSISSIKIKLPSRRK
jgi:preprotein translocase subunit SecF